MAMVRLVRRTTKHEQTELDIPLLHPRWNTACSLRALRALCQHLLPLGDGPAEKTNTKPWLLQCFLHFTRACLSAPGMKDATKK